MAKKKSKSRSKSSRRVLDAFQLAEREINGEFDDTSDNDKRNDARRNGTVVNLLKRSKGGAESDEDDIGTESFEDEELNSDEALGSDDDYDVLNSKFSQTIRDKKKKNADYEDDEDEGGYTSIDEEDLMPLSKVWDMDSKTVQNGNDEEDTSLQLKLQDTDASTGSSSSEVSESESESEDEDEEDPFDEISEDEEDIELNTITAKLIDETKSKVPKRLDTYGTGEANEYVLPSVSATNASSGKLTLADMMNVVDDRQVIENANLLKGKSSTYEVPLPQRIQQRHERKACLLYTSRCV